MGLHLFATALLLSALAREPLARSDSNMVSTDETSTNFRGNDTHTQLQRGAVGSLTAFAVVADIRFIGMAAIGSALFASSAPTAPVERLRMETDNSIHPCAQSAQYKPAFTDTGLALQRLLPLHRHIHHLCPLAAQMGMTWQPLAARSSRAARRRRRSDG